MRVSQPIEFLHVLFLVEKRIGECYPSIMNHFQIIDRLNLIHFTSKALLDGLVGDINPESLEGKAQTTAIVAHAHQRHGDRPYYCHLFEVAEFAKSFMKEAPGGYLPSELKAAAWLHDIIEDAGYSYNDVRKVFGEQVADIVFAVTNDAGKTRKERAGENYYAKIRDNPGAVYIKLCDRIANVTASGERMRALYRDEMPGFLDSLRTEIYPLPQVMVDCLNELVGLD